MAAIVAPGVQQLRSLQLVRLQAMPSLSAKILVLAPLALCVTAKRLVDDGAKAITLTAAEDESDYMTCKEGDPYLCGQLRDWKYLGNGQCCTSKWAECTSGDNYLCQKAGWDYLGKGQCCRTSDQKVWLTCEKVDQYLCNGDWTYLGKSNCCTTKWAVCTTGDQYLCGNGRQGWKYLGKSQCCHTSDWQEWLTCKEGDQYLCNGDFMYFGQSNCCTMKWAACVEGDQYACGNAGWTYIGKKQCCKTSDHQIWASCVKGDSYHCTGGDWKLTVQSYAQSALHSELFKEQQPGQLTSESSPHCEVRENMPDEGSIDVPPPPSGLGNFKGVMLCNRPSDDSKLASDIKEPFRSAVAQTSELGLPPVRAKNFEPTVKKRGPSAALRRHVRWLRELQEQMREDRNQVEQEEQDEEEKRQKLKANFDKHREAVRGMMKERDDKKREEQAAAKAEKAAKAAEAKAKASETSAPPETATETEKERHQPAKVSKPLWAMTEQEKDTFEEEEADDLINFVENLDFDKFVGDLEFRQALGALKDRTGKLKKEQDAFRDELLANFRTGYDDDEEASTAAGSAKLEDGVDGQSVFGDLKSEKEGRENVQKDWDNSTNAEERPAVDHDVKEFAEAVLEQNPKFRAIHSGASVQKIIEKVRGEQAVEINLVDHMRLEAPCPVPVITASSDTQNRLYKPVDPSMLPYLYRSPAI
eukprot:symbB.v1.2.005413.t1/scaffold316.1/size230253/28